MIENENKNQCKATKRERKCYVPTWDSSTHAVKEDKWLHQTELPHFVPKDWEFPARLSVKKWDLATTWPVFDRFKNVNLAIELKEEHRMRFSRVKSVIEYCLEVMQKLKTSVAKLSLQEKYIIDTIYDKRPGRPMELSYGAICNLKHKTERKRKSS